MIKQIIKILGLLLLFSCNTIDYNPKYKDFENSWERENLIGKVKTFEKYKANVSDFKTGEADNPVIEFKKEFTELGNISYQEYFDNFGKLEQYIKNEYNEKGHRVKSISENFLMPSKSIETIEYNAKGKQISVNIILNDTLTFNAKFEYNNDGYLINQTEIQDQDTTNNIITYIFNESGNITLKKQIQNCKYGIYEYINTFKYDNENNLLESQSKSNDFGSTKVIYSYDNKNRIEKITQYQNDEIEKETLFDKFYNQILVRFYDSVTLDKEMKYKYSFDNKGNWIERKIYMKEHFGKDKNWKPVYIETRKIEYYE